MTRYRDDNTEGYTPAQLKELNRRFEAKIATLTPNEREDKSITDAISERILADFDVESP